MPYNTVFTAYIDAERKKFCSIQTGHTVLQPPTFVFGDRIGVSLQFDSGVIASGDKLMLVIDDDYYFYASDANLAAMSVATCEATAQDSVNFTASTRFPKFRDATNGKERVIAIMTLSRVVHSHEGYDDDEITIVPLAEGKVICKGLLADEGDAPVELDVPTYYTKAEIDAIKAAMDRVLSDTESAQSAAETAARQAETWTQGDDEGVEELGGTHSAKRHAQLAGGSADDAETAADMAESYTHGGTGKRQGEDTDNARYYLEQLGNHETNAREAAEKAETWAEGADADVAELGGTKSAKGHAQAAGQSETKAKTSEDNADGYRNLAESYAHGGTGRREGENTDNALYYNQQAGQKAEEAAKLAEGTDEEVEGLGIEHSAKKWAEMGQEAYNAIAYQIDGGSAASTYTETQKINGGNA